MANAAQLEQQRRAEEARFANPGLRRCASCDDELADGFETFCELCDLGLTSDEKAAVQAESPVQRLERHLERIDDRLDEALTEKIEAELRVAKITAERRGRLKRANAEAKAGAS